MRRAAIAISASLLALALIAPAAQGATKIHTYRAEMFLGPTPSGPESGGSITLEVVFKNKRTTPKRFTPRLVRRIEFEKVPLRCANSSGEAQTQLQLTRTLKTKIKLKKAPPPVAKKPKKRRYAFKFSHSFQGFDGTIGGKIDKKNGKGSPRAHGSFVIRDLDENPGRMNCATNGPRSWSAPRPV